MKFKDGDLVYLPVLHEYAFVQIDRDGKLYVLFFGSRKRYKVTKKMAILKDANFIHDFNGIGG